MSKWHETDIGILPEDWDCKFIGDIADVTKLAGYEYTKHITYTDDGEIIALRALNVREGKLDLSDIKRINKKVSDDLPRSKLYKNDILFTYVGANIGQFALIPEDELFHLAPNICRIRCGEKCEPYFVFSYFRTNFFRDSLDGFSHGSSQPTLPMKNIRLIPVPVPSQPEQKAIAAVLSSLDGKIDLLHRQNQTLEAMAETLFRQWFVVEAQEDWEDTTLEQHTDVFRGLSYKGSGLTTFGLGKPMHNLNSVFEGGGYKNIGIKYYSGDFKERHIVNAGDIIVTNTEQGHDFRLIGYPAIVPKYFGENGLFSQHIYRLVPKSISYLTTEYLYYLLMTPVVREQVTSATNGSTVNMLAIDGLQRPEFKLPPKEKIVSFTEAVKSCWKKNEINQNQIRTLETLRDTLLPKLMSGEVRVHFDGETA